MTNADSISFLALPNAFFPDSMNKTMKNLRNMFLAVIFLVVQPVYAGKVLLKIRVANPLNASRMVSIRSNLPVGVISNHVISHEGLDIGYDVKEDIYFVYANVELGPKDNREYDVEINDVWVIPEEELSILQNRKDELTETLKDTKYSSSAEGLAQTIAEGLEVVKKRQEDNTIRADNVLQHIAAYEKSMKDLKRVKLDVGYLENLVLGLGDNPGKLIGADESAPPPNRNVKIAPEDYRTAIIKVTVSNTSPTEVRSIDIKHDLPSEINADDVFEEENGLKVGTDFKRGICYVYKDDVELKPGGSVVFNVKIRDKWNVNMPRIPLLRENLTNLIEKISIIGKYSEIEESLAELETELGSIEAEQGPTTLSAGYVAYYRQQADRIDLIEEKINRIKAVLKPMEGARLGFKAKPPSTKSTWMIIYMILGFLAVVSLLFFLRWYGKGKDEVLMAASEADKQGGGK